MRKAYFEPQKNVTLRYSNSKTKMQISTDSGQTRIRRRDSLNPLEDLVQCPLCMDKLLDPKMLPCQHTYCLSCLQSHLQIDSDGIHCPACKQFMPLENGLKSLEQLPGNLYIDSILKLLSGNNPPCTPTTLAPETQCIKCQTLCQFSEHACQHCKQIFCGVCWPTHIVELKSKFMSLHEELTESQNRLNHRIEAFKDRCSQLEENIKTATKIKIDQIKTKEKECLMEADKIRQKQMDISEELRKRVKELQKNINEKEFDKAADDHQKILQFISLHRNTAALLDEVCRWGDTRTIFDSTDFKIECDTEATVDAEADDGDVAVEVRGVQNPMESPDNLVLYYKSRNFVPRLVWTKCLRPAAVNIPPWATNCMYIAGSDSRNIYIVDRQKGKLLSRISSPAMLCPVGIAFLQKREEIFITDKWRHCVHVFSKDGTHLRSIGSKGSFEGQFRSPEGLCAGPDDRVYICDTGNDRIQVLQATDGRFLFSFGITGTGMSTTASGIQIDYKYTELNVPTGIAVTDDKIIVADSGNRRIKIYTLNGEKLFEFGSLGKNKGQFRTPEVVAVDPMGFILVGDSGNARIQIFRPNGALVRVFGSRSKFGWISGLCVTPQLEIIVTDYKSHTVNIF